MDVLIICQYHPPDMGGGSKRVSNAIAGLKRLGHNVEIITAFPHYPHGIVPKKFKRKSVVIEKKSHEKIFRVWVPSVAHKGFLRRFMMYIIFSITSIFALPFIKRPTVIWAANPNVFSSFPAMLISVVTRAPIVRNVDDLWPETAFHLGFLSDTMNRIGSIIARIAYTFSKKITPISSAYSKILIDKYHVSPGKLTTVEVGVDTDKFQRVESTDSKNKQFTIVYSGLLGLAYDFDTILDAAVELQEDSSITFHIRGVGELEQSIRNGIKDRNLENVVFSSEFLPQDTLIQLLTNADSLILPMVSEKYSDIGLPTKLIEYMACGRPIICISAGESARIVQRANCGIVTTPGNSAQLAEAIRKLEQNEEREQLGINGRRYAVENFSLEQIASKLETAFLDAIKN